MSQQDQKRSAQGYPPADSWADTPHAGGRKGGGAKQQKRDMPPWRRRFYLVWDAAILVLVALSLLLILVDTLYMSATVRTLLEAASLEAPVRFLSDHFRTIDLWFVAIFLLDVLIGWGFAIWERRYHRWFFYPFVHWYDVLGSIPVGGFRLLRILRVVGLLMRLQHANIIDMRTWRIYRFLYKYYEILLEEISDRVIVRTLTDVQEGFLSHGELSRRVTDEVLMPRKQQIIDDVSRRVQRTLGESYAYHRDDLNAWVGGIVHRAVTENPTIRTLQRMPMGDRVVEAMDEAIRDVTNRLIREAVVGLRSPDFRSLIEEVANRAIERSVPSDAREYQALEEVMNEVIDVIKSEVKVQRWKERYQAGA